MSLITYLSKLRKRPSCEHPRIFIAGTKNGMQARYQCKECGKEVDPTKLDGTYKPL